MKKFLGWVEVFCFKLCFYFNILSPEIIYLSTYVLSTILNTTVNDEYVLYMNINKTKNNHHAYLIYLENYILHLIYSTMK